jgi:glucose dehydrogenase
MQPLRLASALIPIAVIGVLAAAIAEGPDNRSWRDFGGGPSASHFVDLDQIKKSNVAGLGARNGMIVTQGGLVFVAGGDGKVRAYDEENGHVRAAGRGERAGGPGADAPADAPRGYIAFALPK